MPSFFRIMILCSLQPEVELRRALRVISTVQESFLGSVVVKMDGQDLPAETSLKSDC